MEQTWIWYCTFYIEWKLQKKFDVHVLKVREHMWLHYPFLLQKSSYNGVNAKKKSSIGKNFGEFPRGKTKWTNKMNFFFRAPAVIMILRLVNLDTKFRTRRWRFLLLLSGENPPSGFVPTAVCNAPGGALKWRTRNFTAKNAKKCKAGGGWRVGYKFP